METQYGMYLAYFFQTLIGLNCIYAFVTGNLAGGFFSALIMFLATLVPFIIAHRMNIHFPWFVFFLIALALWFHTAGYIQGYYEMFYPPYYDKIAHLVSGTTVALLGFLGVIFLDRYWNMNLTAPPSLSGLPSCSGGWPLVRSGRYMNFWWTISSADPLPAQCRTVWKTPCLT
ncbi:hypothetical protein [Methanogenium cariaci]|uniref:hypothetical protein n=1 Tax=Methanogenium cariaci TaxID=2197 RepID=UPI0012F6D777|nr:hypothetical protein [Methanogenium cariaci]